MDSINGKRRDELPDHQIFCALLKAKVPVERWCEHFKEVCSHTRWGHPAPAPEAEMTPGWAAGGATLRRASPGLPLGHYRALRLTQEEVVPWPGADQTTGKEQH